MGFTSVAVIFLDFKTKGIENNFWIYYGATYQNCVDNNQLSVKNDGEIVMVKQC